MFRTAGASHLLEGGLKEALGSVLPLWFRSQAPLLALPLQKELHVSDTARALMKSLNLAKERKHGPSEKDLRASVGFLWSVGQKVTEGAIAPSRSEVSDFLSPILTAFDLSSDGEKGADGAIDSLLEQELWEEIQVEDAAGEPVDVVRLAPVYSDFFDVEPQWSLSVVSAVLTKFFPGASEAFLGKLDLEEFTRGRLHSSMLPKTGDWFFRRKGIAAEYGGNNQHGITRFYDGYVSAISKTSSPYADKVMQSTGWIAYVGDGLEGDQKLTAGNRKMAECQNRRTPVRFWRGDETRGYRFETWAVIVQRRRQWGIGDDEEPRKEYVWVLAPVPSPDVESWPHPVRDALNDEVAKFYDETRELEGEDVEKFVQGKLEVEFEGVTTNYVVLDSRAVEAERVRRASSAARKIQEYFRSPAARKAVMQRSGGKCESPECLGHPAERAANGDPILEVDHVRDLAQGGKDLPVNMIALCPNCHALKTRGKKRDKLRKKLIDEAWNKHQEMISG